MVRASKVLSSSENNTGISKNSLSIKKNDEVKVKETLSKLQTIIPKCCDGEDQLEIMQQAIYYIQDLREMLEKSAIKMNIADGSCAPKISSQNIVSSPV